MTVRARISGVGPDLVLLHGWALHGGVWRETAQDLSSVHRVTVLDLPGHGRSDMLKDEYTLPRLAEALAPAVPDQSIIAGWSLGGMVALQLALDFTQKISGLILIDSNPQFVADQNWPWGMEAAVLDKFAEQLKQDHAGTTNRFLALQVLMAEDARNTLARLKEHMATAPPPEEKALEGGLGVLRHASLVSRLKEIRLPVMIIHGEYDALVPLAAARAMRGKLPHADLHVIRCAGHAPFLSHRNEVVSLIREFHRKGVSTL